MKTKILIPTVLALAIVIVAPYAIHPAEAHILKNFAPNVSVKIGWLKEPPFIGDINELDVFVYNGTTDSAPPIADTGLDNMTVTMQYGGQTRVLSMDASDDTPGLYTSAMTPTHLGTYNTIIKGTINGVSIPATTYPMQEVEAKDNYYFPPMSGNMQGMNMSNNGTSNATVPEFGPVASLVLVITIFSVIVITGKTRGFLKF